MHRWLKGKTKNDLHDSTHLPPISKLFVLGFSAGSENMEIPSVIIRQFCILMFRYKKNRIF